MEFINFFKSLNLPIDVVIILLVLLAGQFQKKYLFNLQWNGALKTLVVSFIFTTIYAGLLIVSGKYNSDLPVKWFFSSVLATSLYELILKKLREKYCPGDKNLTDDK